MYVLKHVLHFIRAVSQVCAVALLVEFARFRPSKTNETTVNSSKRSEMEWPRDICDDLDDFRLERSIRSVKVKKTNSKRFESNEIAIKLILDSRRT